MTMAEIIQITALVAVALNGLATLGVVTLVFLAAGRSGAAPLPMPGRKKEQRKEQQQEEVRSQERSEAGEILE